MLKLSLFFVLLLSGCYKTGPEKDELHTVPVTNNLNQYPNMGRTNPLSAMGY